MKRHDEGILQHTEIRSVTMPLPTTGFFDRLESFMKIEKCLNDLIKVKEQ